MKILVIILICLVLSGCVTPTFYKAGITQEQWNKDCYECRQQAGAGSMDNMFYMRKLLWECMEARGYTKQ
jgi:hypothetical protein